MAKRYLTRDCDCTAPAVMGRKRPEHCQHGNRFQTEAELNPPQRSSLRPVSPKRQAEEDAGTRPRRHGSTLNAGRGFAVAAPQRAKVKGLVCVGCGRGVADEENPQWAIDPAHLWPRGMGGCDDPRCVVPLCRHLFISTEGCHPAFDRGDLELLPRLVDSAYFAEMAHAIEAHQLSPLTLVNRLTGEEHVGKAELESAQARIVELEAGIAA
jgi:hypothetical protein